MANIKRQRLEIKFVKVFQSQAEKFEISFYKKLETTEDF